MREFRPKERAFDASIVFRVVSNIPTKTLADQLPRRERWILLLLDGKRCIADLAHLTQRSELDVAFTLTGFLQQGYIETVVEHPSQKIRRAWVNLSLTHHKQASFYIWGSFRAESNTVHPRTRHSSR